MNIYGLQRTTLLDFPGYVACTVFLSGCNLKCPFCHNSELIPQSNSLITKQNLFTFLQNRKDKIDGVCVTGGEPLLQQDIITFIQEIKDMGYLVKLDTNGTVPEKLKHLIECGLVDYVAMDIKNCIEKYPVTCGYYNMNTTNIKTSINILLNSNINYEFRTTVVKQFHDVYDIIRIGNMIKGCRNYYLQKFKPADSVLDKNCSALSDNEMLQYLKAIQAQIPNAKLRGVDGYVSTNP